MNLNELQNGIYRCATVVECDEFLKSAMGEIRPVFYGRSQSELRVDLNHLEYDDAIHKIAASRVGLVLSSRSEPCPDSILALLIFFMSFFERTRLFNAFNTAADMIPAGNLRDRAKAIFQYKNITDAETNYIERFDKIAGYIQSAWNSGDEDSCKQCIDLIQEYFLDAILEAREANIDITAEMQSIFQCRASLQKYSVLSDPKVQGITTSDIASAERSRDAVRSRIIESLHAEACRLVPEALLVHSLEETAGEELPSTQAHRTLPAFLDDQLQTMSAKYEQQWSKARKNFDNDTKTNQIYLGTFLPRTVVESWNIFSELLSMPVIEAAFSQKEVIRILDIGSGTGGAVLGFLLALNTWGRCEVSVEITSIDVNDDALEKQDTILNAIAPSLPFQIYYKHRKVALPFNLEGFVPALSAITAAEGPQYDVVSCWKCLCEFYNENFAQAQGIVRHTLDLASQMLVPFGLCVAADITTKDNDFEFFSMTLNREINEHDRDPDAVTQTILPIPCAHSSISCSEKKCFSQRRFSVSHRLIYSDSTKIAYRVLAPKDFATSIIAGFNEKPAYGINAARPREACSKGSICMMTERPPCGYTGFF